MTEEELQEFLRKLAALRAQRGSSPEKARQVLIEEGYLTETGEIAEPYRSPTWPYRAPSKS